MKRIARLASLALAGSTIGCAQPDVWYKPGVSDAEMRRDSYECERDTRMSAASFGGGIAGQVSAQNFYDQCLYVRGYTKTAARAPLATSTGAAVADGDMINCNTPDNRPIFRTTAAACVAAGGEIRSR